ncbi:MAG TPA: hypothetical protein VF479_09260 [Pseudolysinimonas sp.]
MQFVLAAIDRWGGIASTSELAASGVERSILDIAVMYGKVIRVRKGLWSRPELPREVLDAHRAGGRLACVSALAFHGVIEPVDGLHVAAPFDVTKWKPRPRRDVVRHWSRRPIPGDKLAVTVEAAWAQFALCRAVAGRDVRLRRTDSL